MEEKIKEITEALTDLQDKLEKSLPKELYFDIVYHVNSEKEAEEILADPNAKVYCKTINDKGEPMWSEEFHQLGLNMPLSPLEMANIGSLNINDFKSGRQASINFTFEKIKECLRGYIADGDIGPLDTLKRILNEYDKFIEFRDGPALVSKIND